MGGVRTLGGEETEDVRRPIIKAKVVRVDTCIASGVVSLPLATEVAAVVRLLASQSHGDDTDLTAHGDSKYTPLTRSFIYASTFDDIYDIMIYIQ